MNKVLLLELNEVPFRVIDYYCDRRPNSALSVLLSKSAQYETYTEDSLALDPWISWPTMHRGVTDKEHQILHLGQVLDDADVAYPPIWQLLKKKGISVGVFGSLHSSAVPKDADEYGFYVPDYFDNRIFAHPSSLTPFQEFNLKMTRGSARNVSRKLPVATALKFVATAPSVGLSAATATSIAGHLIKETLNADLRIRRRNYQAVLSADLFFKQLRNAKPQFASFYSNHVAAAMHRYWGAAFPGDFAKGSLEDEWIEKYCDEIIAAMDAFDQVLKKTVRFVDSNPDYTLIVASSMGQAAIPATHTYEFLTIANLAKFLAAMGVPESEWEVRPAMVPCQCAVISEQYRKQFLENLRTLKIGDSTMVENTRPVGPMSYDERERGFFQVFIQFDRFRDGEQIRLNGKAASIEKLGLGKMAHEDGVNCTAQHIPEGSLIVYRSGCQSKANTSRERISTTDFVPSVLSYFGVGRPQYLKGDVSINLS